VLRHGKPSLSFLSPFSLPSLLSGANAELVPLSAKAYFEGSLSFLSILRARLKIRLGVIQLRVFVSSEPFLFFSFPFLFCGSHHADKK